MGAPHRISLILFVLRVNDFCCGLHLPFSCSLSVCIRHFQCPAKVPRKMQLKLLPKDYLVNSLWEDGNVREHADKWPWPLYGGCVLCLYEITRWATDLFYALEVKKFLRIFICFKTHAPDKYRETSLFWSLNGNKMMTRGRNYERNEDVGFKWRQVEMTTSFSQCTLCLRWNTGKLGWWLK